MYPAKIFRSFNKTVLYREGERNIMLIFQDTRKEMILLKNLKT